LCKRKLTKSKFGEQLAPKGTDRKSRVSRWADVNILRLEDR
jgi:hypothetical protein